MKLMTRLLPGMLLAGLFIVGGCGRKEEQPTRLNKTLGDSAVGVPTSPGNVDPAILSDQAAYKPAQYEPLEGRRTGGGGTPAAGPEAEAIRGLLDDYYAALFEMDIDTLLDSFDPEQVAALREDDYMSTFYETQDAFRDAWAMLKDKASGPEIEAVTTLISALPTLAQPLADATTIEVIDEENAVARFDLQQFQLPEEFMAAAMDAGEKLMPVIMGSMMGGEVSAGEPGAEPMPAGPPMEFSPEMFQQMMAQQAEMGGQQNDTPLRKIDGEWKMVLPVTIQEEHADLVNEALLLVKDLLGELTAQFDQAETLDAETLTQIATPVIMSKTPAFLGLSARFEAMAADFMAAQAEAAEAGDETGEEEVAEDPNDVEDSEDSNEPAIPTGRGGRGGRRP